MSYAIIRNITISDDKVMITSADNNVYPRTPSEWECTSLSKLLKEKGREAVDIELLKDYESGNIQKGSNKYTRALEVLLHMPEYKAFDWHGEWKTSQDARTNRKDEFEALLLRALNTRLPSEKYIITKKLRDGGYGNIAYLRYRKGAHICKWYYDISKATPFKFKEDAEDMKKWFTNSRDWEIIPA